MAATESNSSRKNVVVLVLDSLRKDRISTYNDDIEFTSNLEELEENSLVFQNAVSQAPWTLPSTASIFTGQYPWKHGATQVNPNLDTSKETLVDLFNEEGYHTATITSNVWITPQTGMAEGFDHVDNFLTDTDNLIVEKALDFSRKIYDQLDSGLRKKVERKLDYFMKLIEIDPCRSEKTVEEVKKYLEDRSEDGENFFLFANLMEPHEPYIPPKKYMNKHGVEYTSGIPERQTDMFGKDLDFEELEKIYEASADYTDDLVGEILDSIKDNGLDQNTVLCVISDHGQALGEEGLFGHQFNVNEDVINTVMMVNSPEKNRETEERLFELRNLRKLVPHYAGLREKPEEVFSEKARGGYEFPEQFDGSIPSEKRDQYFRKYRYVKTRKRKTVKTIKENGEEEYMTTNLESGEEIETTEGMRSEIDSIKDVEQEKGDVEEEIKDRLEELGYT